MDNKTTNSDSVNLGQDSLEKLQGGIGSVAESRGAQKILPADKFGQQKQLNVFTVQKTYADFSTGATSKSVTLFQLPAQTEIISCWMNVKPSFSGGAIGSYTLQVGTGIDTDGLLTAQDAQSVGLKLAIGNDFTALRPIYSMTGGTDVIIVATSTVANLSAATQGVVQVFFTTFTYASNN